MRMKLYLYYILVLCSLISCTSRRKIHTDNFYFDTYHYTIQKSLTIHSGAVVSAHALASRAGAEMLKRGGNAIDAAIATQWALAVVFPGAGNIGGGGFMVANMQGKHIALDYRETAPAAAYRDMYLDSNGNPVDEKSLNGHLAAGVPGTVSGLFAAHQYAKLPMSVLLKPAIDLAEKGFILTADEATGLNNNKKAFEQYNTTPIAFIKKEPWKKGDTLIQKDLAATLRRIRDHGTNDFYEGETAALLVKEMQRGKGIITLADLKQYTAKYRQPHIFNYRGYTVMSMPMPSSGGVLLHQMLKMIEPFDIAKMGFESAAAVQLMVEAERRAFADRAVYMGDADFYNVPVHQLTDSIYIHNRMKDYNPDIAGKSTVIKAGYIPGYESEETTHISIIDKEGNAVAVTTTLNNWYGSKTVVGGAGFLLNDEMDDFSAKPGSANLFGAVGGKANAIAPGKRMLSSMTPTIVLNNNKPYIVLGTPGGTTIPTSVFQTIVDIIDFNMSTNDAVNKAKFHHQWLPDRIDVEKNFPKDVARKLESKGYTLYERNTIGRTEVIKALTDGRFEAVADGRGGDSADGY